MFIGPSWISYVFPRSLRFNERKLAMLARQEKDDVFRQRAGRLDKWKEVARQAAAERAVNANFPDQIQTLSIFKHVLSFVIFFQDMFDSRF